MIKIPVTTLLIACAVAPLSHAANWQPLSGASTLQEFVSGATVEIELEAGVIATGKYHADGTAEIEAWNETFERTWAVKGDDQVCYTSDLETNCYRFEQDLDDPGQYRSRNVETGEAVVFRLTGAVLDDFAAATPVDNEGGLGSPSASEIAAAQSDPNTTLGTLNFQLDLNSFSRQATSRPATTTAPLCHAPGTSPEPWLAGAGCDTPATERPGASKLRGVNPC